MLGDADINPALIVVQSVVNAVGQVSVQVAPCFFLIHWLFLEEMARFAGSLRIDFAEFFRRFFHSRLSQFFFVAKVKIDGRERHARCVSNHTRGRRVITINRNQGLRCLNQAFLCCLFSGKIQVYNIHISVISNKNLYF